MKTAGAAERGPILVVAPTSLLRTWEARSNAMSRRGSSATLVRLYGSSPRRDRRSRRRARHAKRQRPAAPRSRLAGRGRRGRARAPLLVPDHLHDARQLPAFARAASASPRWSWTRSRTSRTSDTIASKAVEAMNADFRIGLTGTPIENSHDGPLDHHGPDRARVRSAPAPSSASATARPARPTWRSCTPASSARRRTPAPRPAPAEG